MDQLKLTGIVLSVFPIGENDKRLTILTKERGKVQVISRRCRRQNHPLFAVSQPLIYGEFVVSCTRNYIYLNSAECRDTFGDIKRDLTGICYSTYFAEVAEYCTVEMQDEREILNLFFLTLQAMRKGLMPLSLIKSVFEYRILVSLGFGLSVFACMHCGKTEDLSILSLRDGGVFCGSCGEGIIGIPIKPTLLYVLQYISSVPLLKLYAFRLQEEIEAEFCRIVSRYFKLYVDHTFKSEKLLQL